MFEIKQHVIPLQVQNDIIIARRMGREMARAIGFNTVDQTKIATAISELTRNVIKYAYAGECTIVDESNLAHHFIKMKVIVRDSGPGIPNIELALQDNYSTSTNSLGGGLPGTRRLMDEFSLQSTTEGTCVTISIMRARFYDSF